jgi:hypothetical protein
MLINYPSILSLGLGFDGLVKQTLVRLSSGREMFAKRYTGNKRLVTQKW